MQHWCWGVFIHCFHDVFSQKNKKKKPACPNNLRITLPSMRARLVLKARLHLACRFGSWFLLLYQPCPLIIMRAGRFLYRAFLGCVDPTKPYMDVELICWLVDHEKLHILLKVIWLASLDTFCYNWSIWGAQSRNWDFAWFSILLFLV